MWARSGQGNLAYYCLIEGHCSCASDLVEDGLKHPLYKPDSARISATDAGIRRPGDAIRPDKDPELPTWAALSGQRRAGVEGQLSSPHALGATGIWILRRGWLSCDAIPTVKFWENAQV